MLLVLDIGNTQIFGAVFADDKIILRFRKSSRDQASSDEYGLFLKATLRENGIEPQKIKNIMMSSVVPDLNHSVASACIKYFNLRPLILEPGIKTGLKILVHNPGELGADRVANAVGASLRYPNKNLIIFDLGTASTGCVINKNKEYLGGLITPGMRLMMEVLEQKTAKLPTVEIRVPTVMVGKNTVEQIQAGLYYSTLGMVREFIKKVASEEFKGQDFIVLGTGGFARVFEGAKLFDVFEPDLILYGLRHIFELNETKKIL
jgi:type III pantothenate kinase